MHIVTVATKNEGYFNYLVQSCKRNGATLEVLGWGQEWKGFTMKFELMQKYLEKLPDDDIVAFVDGYDVIILQPVEKIEKLFRESGKKIIVSSDIDTHGLIWAYIFNWYYGSCNGYSINSGTYIGYVKDLKVLFHKIRKLNQEENNNDDQILLTKVCQQYKEDVSIDTERHIFLVTNNNDSIFHKIQIKNKNLEYNNFQPCILHMPGNSNMNQILKELGYDIDCVKRRSFIHHASYATFTPVIIKIMLFMVLLISMILILFYRNMIRKS